MAATDTNSSWEKIRQGVKEAETLIGQKKYNLSMVKSRQTLEYMVNCLCEKAGIMEADLAASIDALYSSRWISKTTCEHYHKIRMLGNKAVHEGSENAYDANQAYHLLSQEVYTFANDYNARKRRPAGAKPQSQFGGRTSSSGSSGSSSSSRSRKKTVQKGFHPTSTDIVRLLVVLLGIVVLVLLIRFIKPKKSDSEETTPPVTVEQNLPETTPAPETMAETTGAPVYKTSDNLNVRSEPSTSGSKLGLLPAGTIVDYVEDYDDQWAIINYNGSQAYVAKQYLVHD